METQNRWMLGGGHAGPILPEAWVVLVRRSGGGHLLALLRVVLGGCVLLRLGSSLHVRKGRCLLNPLVRYFYMQHSNQYGTFWGSRNLKFCNSAPIV